MIMRRLYIKGRRYAYHYHAEIDTYAKMVEFAESHPDAWDLDNATYFFDELTKEEQGSYWNQTVDMILNHTAFALNNLSNLPEYKVSWNSYKKNNPCVGLPPKNRNIYK